MNDIKSIFKHMNRINLDYGPDTLSVHEVLQLPVFRDAEVLGGNLGLDNNCKHMTILETPEGISWLKGQEFLLTAGYAIKGNKKAKENMILEAHENGVSAIGIKDNRYFGDIWDELIADSNKYKIPLIKIPHDIVYTETISGFYDLLFYRKNKYILNLNNIYEKLLDLTFENKDIDGILRSLSNISDANIFLFDNDFNGISKSIIDEEKYKDIINYMDSKSKRETLLKSNQELNLNYRFRNILISIFPIIKDDEKNGFLCLIKNSRLTRMDQRAIDYGVSMINRRLQKQVLMKLGRDRLNKTLVEMMINNNNLSKEFFNNLEEDLGWDTEGEVTGVCIKANREKSKSYVNLKKLVYEQIDRCLGEDNYLSTDREDKIFVFFKLQKKDYLKDIIETMSKCMDNIKVKSLISIGVSNIYNSLSKIERLYDESYLAASFSNNGITYYHTLDTIKLLYPLKNDKETNLYYKDTIQKIINYDEENDMNLLNTLETYFKNNMNKKSTSEELFIHVETLRYRLSRVKDITGIDISDIEGIFGLKMGLKLKVIMDLK